MLFCYGQKIIGTSSALTTVAEHSLGDEVVNVSQSSVLRTPADFAPFGGETHKYSPQICGE